MARAAIAACCGTAACSSTQLAAAGASGPVTRATGAFSASNACSARKAQTSAATPQSPLASCTTIARLYFTERSSVAVSSGLERAQVDHLGVDAVVRQCVGRYRHGPSPQGRSAGRRDER